MYIKPKLEILPEAQKELFPHLKEVPNHFVLYGGTAIALRYGHRQSVDFDFFTSVQNIDLEQIGRSIPFMKRFEETGDLYSHKHNDHHVDFVLTFSNTSVQVSFINNRDLIPGVIKTPDTMMGNAVKIASPIDLMAAKILALHNRTDAKDYFDVHELIKRGVSLQKGYEAAYAISKLSSLRSGQLMLDRLNAEFQSKTVLKIVSESNLEIISQKAQDCMLTLQEAASTVKLDKIYKTSIKADKNLIKSVNFERRF